MDKEIYVEIKRVFFEDIVEEKNENGILSTIQSRKIYGINEVRLNSRNLEQTIQVMSSQDKSMPMYLNYPRGIYNRRRNRNIHENAKTIPVSYIPTQFLSMDSLAELWDKAILTDYFDNVKKGLKLISSNLEDVAFIKVNPRYNNNYERTGITKVKEHTKPIPLNSMGDGVLRILQLVLGIFPASDGILLIDEFENGLHYSIQEKVWDLIFKLSKELNIQVFATTHSWDCIKAFTSAANSNNEDAVLCRIGKSINNDKKNIATIFEKEALDNLTQSDVELR
jgi:hypothetical protein